MSRRARRYAEATAAKRGDLMAQDLSPGLTAWLAAQPDARIHAREAAEAIAEDYPCRGDGRCQYAIDSGAEGMGHCPAGKCKEQR